MPAIKFSFVCSKPNKTKDIVNVVFDNLIYKGRLKT